MSKRLKVWLSHEQAQRLTGSGLPSEVDELRQRVVELETENERLLVMFANEAGTCDDGKFHDKVIAYLGFSGREWWKEYDREYEGYTARGKALIEKGGKQE